MRVSFVRWIYMDASIFLSPLSHRAMFSASSCYHYPDFNWTWKISAK